MKLQLLIAAQLPTCLETRDIWQQVCDESGVILETVQLEQPQGKQLADSLHLKSFPVLLADGKVIAVGRPNSRDAASIIQKLIIS